MKRLLLPVLLLVPLLSGCWDELMFKELQAVTLVGIEGGEGEITVHFAFPAFLESGVEYQAIKADGQSLSDARNKVNSRSSEALNMSQLQILLISSETAKSDVYEFLDNFYRTPHNRLTGQVILVEGNMEDYMGSPEGEGPSKQMPRYLKNLSRTIGIYSLSTLNDLNQAGSLIFSEGIDLSLPMLKMGKEGQPELAGTALFNGNQFSGSILSETEGSLLNILRGKPGKILRLSYEVEVDGKQELVSFELIRSKKMWTIDNGRADLFYHLKVQVEEYPDGAVRDQIPELERQLSKKVASDLRDTVEKLQDAGSDPLGLGRQVRAFHQDLWKKGDWNETFSELDISVEAEVKIARTGILN